LESQLFCYIGWRRTTGGFKRIHQESGKAVLEGRGLNPIIFGQETMTLGWLTRVFGAKAQQRA